MKALLTGSDGFIGTAMHDELEYRGYDVTAIDIKSGNNAIDLFRTSNEQYDLIVHAAYQVGGRVAIDGLNLNLAENAQLDGAMFNYALRTRSKQVLYFSSSAAYPVRLQNGDIPKRLRESDIVLDGDSRGFLGVPDAHYGWAKLTGEKLATQAQKLGMDVSIVRPFSGYAETQSLDYPFPSIVQRAIEGDFTVWGPPEQTRDWIHIDDVLTGCFKILEAHEQRPVNLCTGKGATMGKLMKLAFLENTGKQLQEEIFYDLAKPTGVIHRVGHPELFFKYHRPTVSLREGIRRALI